MYIRVYIHIYKYVYVCMYTHTYTYMNIYIRIYTLARVCIDYEHEHKCKSDVSVCMRVCVRAWVCRVISSGVCWGVLECVYIP